MNKPIIDNSLTGTRSTHNTSCNWTGTADFGRLVPFHIEELDPTVHVKTCRPRIEMQMLPLASPTFGKIDLYVHYFFVPTRLLWEGANNFFERQGPLKNSTPPYITPDQIAEVYMGESEYRRGYFKHWTSLGLPPFWNVYTSIPTSFSTLHLTLLKFRAYQQIWWDFYRDPELLRDDARYNYLTNHSGAFDPQNADYGLADQRVLMPRVRNYKDVWFANLFSEGGLSYSDNPAFLELASYADNNPFAENNVADDDKVTYSAIGSAKVSRTVEALSRFSERLSLGGKRAIDAMFAAYGVKPNFLKMEMAQYVGGAKSSVLISDITSSADTVYNPSGEHVQSEARLGSPLGAKAGAGYCSFSDLNIDYTAQEHGFLVGIFSVMPHVHFTQGLDKSWFRNSTSDFFMKSLERTGQVAVSKKEIAVSCGTYAYPHGNDDNIFAFTQPYYENKRGFDILAGDFSLYHYGAGSGGEGETNYAYMQSMDMYVDYPINRDFTSENMTIDSSKFNKVFYYLGGSLWDDVDDHFHLNIDKEVVKDTPYDGYAVPTLETTKDPHLSSANIGGDKVL